MLGNGGTKNDGRVNGFRGRNNGRKNWLFHTDRQSSLSGFPLGRADGVTVSLIFNLLIINVDGTGAPIPVKCD